MGFRLAARRPAKIRALIIQNANAYAEGMSDAVHDLLLRLANDHSSEMKAKAASLFEMPYTKRQYLEGVADPTLVSPDSWQRRRLTRIRTTRRRWLRVSRTYEGKTPDRDVSLIAL